MLSKLKFIILIILVSTLSACAGESFHLRGSSVLPKSFSPIYLQGVDRFNGFGDILGTMIQQSGSTLVANRADAEVVLTIRNLNESKRVVGYGANREVKEYLIFIRFNFSLMSVKTGDILLSSSAVNVDKLQTYDSNFVLGKVEEEAVLRESLRNDAARQVLLRMKATKASNP